MNNIFETFNIQMEVITPVHIGSGEEYIPTDYVIKDGYLIIFSREKFIDKILEANKYNTFLSICEKGDILKIREFIFDNFDNSLAEKKIKVSEHIERDYYAKLRDAANLEGFNKKRVINALEIRKFVYTAFENNPIIPGSSIKGAVRTAILDQFAKNKPFKNDLKRERNDRKLQNYLLDVRERNTSDDPFRMIKFSDFEIKQGNTFIDFIYNISRFDDDNKKVPVKMEMLKPAAILKGTLQLHKNSRFTIKNIFDCCNEHYFDDTYDFEYNKFNYGASKMPSIQSEPDTFYLKIGQHSGAFAVTLDKYRDNNIWHQKLRRRMNHQTTTWMSESFNMPLGWVKCKILNYQGKVLTYNVTQKQIPAENQKNQSPTVVRRKSKPPSENDLQNLLAKFSKN